MNFQPTLACSKPKEGAKRLGDQAQPLDAPPPRPPSKSNPTQNTVMKHAPVFDKLNIIIFCKKAVFHACATDRLSGYAV
jgi:hypothetical protein